MQYDDFGRPIYETAEEYNKANRAKQATYAYTNPEGDIYETNTSIPKRRMQTATQRHANREGARKAKSIFVGVLAVIISINVAIVVLMLRSLGVSTDDFTIFEEAIPEEDVRGEITGTTSEPLVEGFNAFSYKGKTYSLPTTYGEIKDIGFFVEDIEIDALFAPEYTDMLSLCDDEGYSYGWISISNPTNSEIPLEDCVVDYFYIDNPEYHFGNDMDIQFVFGDGLTFDSTYEEVESYFGSPYYVYRDESDGLYEMYEWAYYGEDEMHFVSITYMDGVMISVSIEKSSYEIN